MKKIYSCVIAVFLMGLMLLPQNNVMAGNKDRSGQAGASELLINPWAKSSGWGSVGTSCGQGLEALYTNVAGTGFTKGTEIIFSYTNWLKGSGVNIMAFGLSQKIGTNGGVLTAAVMSMNFGEVDITTTSSPEPIQGTFKPSYLNINLAYAKAFSNSIYGGLAIKLISESISDASATAIALDAGIQYVTGEKDQIKFGIALKNVGASMHFTGDGLSFRGIIPGHGNDNDEFTVEQRSAKYELPATLRIGASYDFLIGDLHRITLAGNFTSNSFTKDQFTLGLEYALKYYLQLRAGYTYQDGIFESNVSDRGTVFTGPSAGFTVSVPFNKEKETGIAIDYSYRATNPFQGTHSIGIKLNF
ncbi:MAG: PorV/PorQ family protein [Bacteroidales bacterium]|nr:PorV/PorQ family protein [Bacteroidales bacterium]MDD4602327.1 PorV/PorQ family protein [Bacteroidales bacterium]